MISNLDYVFTPDDTAARNRARAKYLRDAVRCARAALDAVKAAGADEALLDVMLLQPTHLKFCANVRGWWMADPDMRESVVGPLSNVLHAFNSFTTLNIDEVEAAIALCEEKVETALAHEKAEQ